MRCVVCVRYVATAAFVALNELFLVWWCVSTWYRRGDSGRRDGGRVSVCTDRAAARSEWRRELLTIYRTDAHLFIHAAILCAQTSVRKHESSGKSNQSHV